jgi:hypothetical protein
LFDSRLRVSPSRANTMGVMQMPEEMMMVARGEHETKV